MPARSYCSVVLAGLDVQHVYCNPVDHVEPTGKYCHAIEQNRLDRRGSNLLSIRVAETSPNSKSYARVSGTFKHALCDGIQVQRNAMLSDHAAELLEKKEVDAEHRTLDVGTEHPLRAHVVTFTNRRLSSS